MEKWDWNAMTQITPTLYLSAVTAITDQTLETNKINLIINASKELPMFPPKDSRIETVRVPVHDNVEANLSPYFQVKFT